MPHQTAATAPAGGFESIDSEAAYEAVLAKCTEVALQGYRDGAVFEKAQRELHALYNASSSITPIEDFNAFKEKVFWSSGLQLCRTDINNDGTKDFVVVSTQQGSGNFWKVERVFSMRHNELTEIPLPEEFSESKVSANHLRFYRYEGKQYLELYGSDRVRKYYLWEGAAPRQVFNEASLIDNDHLAADNRAEDERIRIAYDVDGRLELLAQKGKDFTVCGCSNREALTVFYKLKDYLKRNDRQRLARMMRYPIRCKGASGKQYDLRSPKTFEVAYDDVATDAFKARIAALSDEHINGSWKGCWVSGGEVQFTSAILAFSPR